MLTDGVLRLELLRRLPKCWAQCAESEFRRIDAERLGASPAAPDLHLSVEAEKRLPTYEIMLQLGREKDELLHFPDKTQSQLVRQARLVHAMLL